MAYEVAPPKVETPSVAGSNETFPVRRLYTCGDNPKPRPGDPNGPRPIAPKRADGVAPGIGNRQCTVA